MATFSKNQEILIFVFRCKQWKHILGIQHLEKYANPDKCYEILRICSAHFEDKYFSTLGKCRLKKDAFPTLNLPQMHSDIKGVSEKCHLKMESVSTFRQLQFQSENKNVSLPFVHVPIASTSRAAKGNYILNATIIISEQFNIG